MTATNNPKLIIRQAKKSDVQDIHQLVSKVYKTMDAYPIPKLLGQISNFPEGHFVAIHNKKIVGYSASIVLPEKEVLRAHTWKQITGDAYGSTHDPNGDYLYGYETCVDPDIRGNRIGQRFYSERKKLVQYWRLKGIVFGGRIPLLHEHIDKVKSVKNYIKKVQNKEIKDPVLGFHLRMGFEPIGVLEDYIPTDKECLGYAVHLRWRNPQYQAMLNKQKKEVLRPDSVRVVCVQYKQRRINSFKELETMVEYYVDVTADYRADFVVFPELFTMQLLSIKNEQVPPEVAIQTMTKYADRLREMWRRLALKYNVNIIGGSHPTLVGKSLRNVSFIALRDGSLHEQEKIHPTPDEKYWWNIEGGNQANAIETDCGPIGVLICYDSEFPELTRHLVNQGIRFLFVPFLTDNRQGYCRVRYCCQARAVENQIYVAMAGNVGNLPRVVNMDIQYAQSAILTPCDFPFAKDGIAAETTPNVEMVTIADLRTDILLEARANGAVRNLKDRRHDLYSVQWRGR
ncbi:MAG: carbon-nitrogen hydrolase family protein [Bdellovibrionales bacterium]|nr:carbon-nitrogen hydrolase family protein [Bdellovibrionales bacterium]